MSQTTRREEETRLGRVCRNSGGKPLSHLVTQPSTSTIHHRFRVDGRTRVRDATRRPPRKECQEERQAGEGGAGRHGRGANEERTWKHRCFGRCNREPRGSSSSHRLARLPRVRPRLGRSGMGAGAALHCTAWFVSSSRHQRRRPRREWKTGRKRRGGRPARGEEVTAELS